MLKRRITEKKPHVCVFLITLPTAEHRVLEVFPSTLLLQEAYPSEDLRIIGMAFSRIEALLLTKQIIAESYRTRGDVDIEAYLKERSKQGKETVCSM